MLRMLKAIDTPLSISLAETLSPEDQAELLLTVETLKMFTETHPDDDQSLEILKDAYWKLGANKAALQVTRRLADAYMRQGQFSAALLEYEGILSQTPDSPEIKKIIAELDAKLNPHPKEEIALDFGSVVTEPPTPPHPEPSLITTEQTKLPKNGPRRAAGTSPDAPDPNESLARFLIQYRMASREAIEEALCQVRTLNSERQASPEKTGIAAGLLNELIKSGADAETLVTAILDRTKFAFSPLEHYEIDRQIVKMLPETLTLGHRIVPFDIVSRTMLIAVDNPFDNAAKATVQQSVDYHILWHLAMPATLERILRESYRLPA
jgi:hypothetical protein